MKLQMDKYEDLYDLEDEELNEWLVANHKCRTRKRGKIECDCEDMVYVDVYEEDDLPPEYVHHIAFRVIACKRCGLWGTKYE